ncbi:hypothetical protein ACOME3_003595 [Neoechinorhynchus agilis]
MNSESLKESMQNQSRRCFQYTHSDQLKKAKVDDATERDFIILESQEKARRVADLINSRVSSLVAIQKQKEEAREQRELQRLYEVMMAKRRDIDKIANKMRAIDRKHWKKDE